MRMRWNKARTNMPQTFSDVACTVCGCVCDDLRLTFAGERLTHAEGACQLAEPWFAALSNLPDRPAASIEGKAGDARRRRLRERRRS